MHIPLPAKRSLAFQTFTIDYKNRELTGNLVPSNGVGGMLKRSSLKGDPVKAIHFHSGIMDYEFARYRMHTDKVVLGIRN
jgi:hypothetical protein